MMLDELECVECGCTEGEACMTDDGPCSWASMNPPLCTACAVAPAAETSGTPIYGPAGEVLSYA